MNHTNGHPAKEPSVLADVSAMIEDHLDLAALETHYELQQAGKRGFAFAVIFMLALAAFLLAQVAVVFGLAALGLSIWVSCLVIAALYALAAVGIYVRWGRRDPRVGPAFAGTRREVGETLRWVQKIFS